MNSLNLQDDILTLEDIAGLLKLSKNTVYKSWHRWGLKPLAICANAHPRFLKQDVLKILKASK